MNELAIQWPVISDHVASVYIYSYEKLKAIHFSEESKWTLKKTYSDTYILNR